MASSYYNCFTVYDSVYNTAGVPHLIPLRLLFSRVYAGFYCEGLSGKFPVHASSIARFHCGLSCAPVVDVCVRGKMRAQEASAVCALISPWLSVRSHRSHGRLLSSPTPHSHDRYYASRATARIVTPYSHCHGDSPILVGTHHKTGTVLPRPFARCLPAPG